MKILNIFKKNKPKKNDNIYSYLGAAGISLNYFKMYEESIKRINEFEKEMLK